MHAATGSRRALATAVAAAGTLFLVACGVATWNPALHPAGTAPAEGAWLKVHMQSGDLYVLESWDVPEEGEDLSGSGYLYGPDRDLQGSGSQRIPIESVALLETNERETVGRFGMSGLSVMTVISGITTVACLADPKSCFGSCPTFYPADDSDRPVAEGFSSSFARALESRDADDLGLTAGPGPFSLIMRNEALETHAVRGARLRVVPASAGGHTLHTESGELFRAASLSAPLACSAPDGDCLRHVVARDDDEYSTPTDPGDLAAKEEVVLDFGELSGDLGLVVTARNSFVTTYVFYQSLAYAGEQAGSLMASLERGEGDVAERLDRVMAMLGTVEAFVSDAGGPWRPVGSLGEAGPIAADRHTLRLGELNSTDLRVKLRMARGSWRIDEVAVAAIGSPLTPIELPLDSVTSVHGGDPHAFHRLTDPNRHLVTAPGDEYRLWFTIPDGSQRYDVYLESEGYYYEWMRGDWLAEENTAAVATLLLDPEGALRLMASGFKAVEPEMEENFWASRFRR